MRILLDPVIASPILIFGGRQLRDILLCKIWVSNKGVHVPRVSAWWSPTLIIWFWKFKYFGKKSKGIWKYTSTYVHINMNLGNWEKRNKMYTTLMTGDPQFFVQSCKQANPMLCLINVQWLSITAIWSATYYFNILAQYAMFWTTQSSETSQLLWEKVQWNATWSSHFVQLPLELHYHFTGGQLSDVAQQWQHPWGGGRMYLLTAVLAFGEWTEYYAIFQI